MFVFLNLTLFLVSVFNTNIFDDNGILSINNGDGGNNPQPNIKTEIKSESPEPSGNGPSNNNNPQPYIKPEIKSESPDPDRYPQYYNQIEADNQERQDTINKCENIKENKNEDRNTNMLRNTYKGNDLTERQKELVVKDRNALINISNDEKPSYVRKQGVSPQYSESANKPSLGAQDGDLLELREGKNGAMRYFPVKRTNANIDCTIEALDTAIKKSIQDNQNNQNNPNNPNNQSNPNNPNNPNR